MQNSTHLTSLNIQQGPNVKLPTFVCPHEVPMMMAYRQMQIIMDGANLMK